MKGADLRAWIARHLDPLEEHDLWGLARHSDFDLDPAHLPGEGGAALTPAAVLVGLIERPEGLSVLLTRRSDTLRRHTGQVAFPGGRRDPGETPWETALREAEEEVGLDPSLVELVGLSSLYRTGTGYLVTPVVGFIPASATFTPSPDEVAEVFETPFGFLMDPANHERREMVTDAGVKRHFYAMTHESRYIWGATAGMLRALYDRIYGAAVA